MNKPSLNDPQGHTTQQIISQEQQVLLFWLLSKILRRLARRIAWAELSAPDKRRLKATLKMLESDVQLVRIVISAQPLKLKGSSGRVKKAKATAVRLQATEDN